MEKIRHGNLDITMSIDTDGKKKEALIYPKGKSKALVMVSQYHRGAYKKKYRGDSKSLDEWGEPMVTYATNPTADSAFLSYFIEALTYARTLREEWATATRTEQEAKATAA